MGNRSNMAKNLRSSVHGARVFFAFAVLMAASHARQLRLPYFWDEAGYYIPAARDLLAGSLIPHSTPSNAHPPLVLAWLALVWKIFGQSPLVTRCSMLLIAAFSLLGFFRLARTISNSTVARCATLLVAIYPVFFAQSSLAQVDLPAAGFIFWGLNAYFRRDRWKVVLWLAAAAVAKETAILIPAALCLWELLKLLLPQSEKISGQRGADSLGAPTMREGLISVLSLAASAIPLLLWYWYHYERTGFVFGNPEFLRYNLQDNLNVLRMMLALLLRLWQVVGYLNLYVLTIACAVAMKYLPQSWCPRGRNDIEIRPRIEVSTQLALFTVSVVYVGAMSVLGGAVLARYMLPIVPLVILVCVSTVWRRLRFWKPVIVIAAASFALAIFLNPPYGFSPEDNLAYADYIRLHQRAEAFIEAHYAHARVLTAWPASDELSRPYLGFVQSAMKVVRIDDFTKEQLMSAADARSTFDVAFVFSTKYQPPHSAFDRWQLWQEWKTRFFGYHVDISPSGAASILEGNLVYSERHNGQWVGVIEIEGIQEAQNSLHP